VAPEDDLNRFEDETQLLTVADPPAPDRSRPWLPIVLGGLVVLVTGILIGLALAKNEPNSPAALPTATTSSTEIAAAEPTTTLSGALVTTSSTSAPRRAGATTTTTRRRTPGATNAPVPATTTTRPTDRVVGKTSGGGSGTGSTSISFAVTGAWRIDHKVEGAEANITVIDQAGGFSFSYTAPVGSGSHSFNRTCSCRVVVSSPDGTYTVTVVDTAG
jgi:hypothetical protein